MARSSVIVLYTHGVSVETIREQREVAMLSMIRSVLRRAEATLVEDVLAVSALFALLFLALHLPLFV
jgi:hypothetical protein